MLEPASIRFDARYEMHGGASGEDNIGRTWINRLRGDESIDTGQRSRNPSRATSAGGTFQGASTNSLPRRGSKLRQLAIDDFESDIRRESSDINLRNSWK